MIEKNIFRWQHLYKRTRSAVSQIKIVFLYPLKLTPCFLLGSVAWICHFINFAQLSSINWIQQLRELCHNTRFLYLSSLRPVVQKKIITNNDWKVRGVLQWPPKMARQSVQEPGVIKGRPIPGLKWIRIKVAVLVGERTPKIRLFRNRV